MEFHKVVEEFVWCHDAKQFCSGCAEKLRNSINWACTLHQFLFYANEDPTKGCSLLLLVERAVCADLENLVVE